MPTGEREVLRPKTHPGFSDEDVDFRFQETAEKVETFEKKLKWWQALAIAAITAAGTSLIGVARGLYERGEKEGVTEMRLRQLEKTQDQINQVTERLRDMVIDLMKNHRNDNSSK